MVAITFGLSKVIKLRLLFGKCVFTFKMSILIVFFSNMFFSLFCFRAEVLFELTDVREAKNVCRFHLIHD
jgi:hypothetical protein